MIINKDVSALEKYRKKKQISVYEICKLLAVEKKSYYRWLKGVGPMPAHDRRIKELLQATISKREVEIDVTLEALFFDVLLYRRDIIFAFASIPSLEKKMGQSDRTGMIHSFFKTSDLRQFFSKLDDDAIYTLLDDLSNLGKLKVFYIESEPYDLIYDVTFGCELGQAVKTVSVNFNYEPMRFNESYQHVRLFRDKPLTEMEKHGTEVILDVKNRAEQSIKNGLERIASRQPKSREMEILKELRRLEIQSRLDVDKAILKIAEDKK